MEQSYWQPRWADGKLGFHLGYPNPNLVRHWPELAQAERGRVLVPLCGKSADLSWFAERGHEVTGVEFVEQAAVDFFKEREREPTIANVGAAKSYGGDGVTILVGDFFQVRSQDFEPVSFVYDRAALVALPEPRRQEYVRHLASLCSSGCKLMLITFEHDIGSGPPFSVPKDEVERLFGADFELKLVDDHDILEAESRFRERGATFMREQVWLGARR